MTKSTNSDFVSYLLLLLVVGLLLLVLLLLLLGLLLLLLGRVGLGDVGVQVLGLTGGELPVVTPGLVL